MSRAPLVSIHMQSNRPDNFIRFLDRLEASAADPGAIEVIVKIDDDDEAMAALLPSEQHRRTLSLRYIRTPLPDGFYGLWRSMNEMFEICHPDARFVLNLNDEMYFKTANWDLVLRGFDNLFADGIYRLRTSARRHRNYFDVWECGFAPDSAAFTTRRWIEICGGWCPCTGPDSFQQMVAFYMEYATRFDQNKDSRDIAIDSIEIGGEGSNADLDPAFVRERERGAVGPWFELFSYRVQSDAYRRACRLLAHIWIADNARSAGLEVLDDPASRKIDVRDTTPGIVLRSFPYRLSRFRITATNLLRAFNYGYYGGGGNAARRNVLRNSLGFLCLRFRTLDRLRLAYRQRFPAQPRR